MDKEIKELTHQRDLAQSHMKDLLQSVGEDRASRLRVYMFVFLLILIKGLYLKLHDASS